LAGNVEMRNVKIGMAFKQATSMLARRNSAPPGLRSRNVHSGILHPAVRYSAERALTLPV
jgi:hypothetical protein